MTVTNRVNLMEIAAAVMAGGDAPEEEAGLPGMRLAPPSAEGEPVRWDRKSAGQSSFHLVTESAERARLIRAEAAGLGRAIDLGWRPIALGAPMDEPEETAEFDVEIALEERPAALVALGWFPEADGGAEAAERDAAYIGALRTAASRAGASVWAMAASREAHNGFTASATSPESRAPSRFSDDDAANGAPIAFRVVLIA